jgi:hypothetical protein
MLRSRGSSVSIVTQDSAIGWTAGVQFLAEAETFLFATTSRPALGPIFLELLIITLF